MTHNELTNGVLARLNEIGYNAGLTLITDDTLNLTEYVEVAIKDAVLRLEGVNLKECSVNYDGTIDLPEDFVSVVKVKCDSWKRAVAVVTEVDTPAYVLAMNQYTAPTKNNPVVVMSGVRKLQAMPSDKGTMLYNAAYDGESGIKGDKESAQVMELAAEIIYKIFGDGSR